jgi:multidrug resistance efflux pump
MPAEHTTKKKTDRKIYIVAAAIVVLVGGGIAGFAYFKAAGHTISIDNSTLSAPIVNLSSASSGILNQVYVKPGNVLPPNTIVASVGTELIKSTSGGLVVTVNNNLGKSVGPSDTVVATIDPNALRVVGVIDENKGFSRIKVGDPVTFTVDAFGGQTFNGLVDEVAPTANQTGIVFNISNSRETQQFNVKARFDAASYPQLKNGMSSRMNVYLQY